MKKARYSDSQILTILKQAEAGTPDLSVPAETPEGGTPQPGMGNGCDVYPDGTRFCLPGRRGRLVFSPGIVMATLHYHGCTVLPGCRAGGYRAIRYPGDLQHRPGQPVHQSGLYRPAQGEWHPQQHGWQGLFAGQHLRRTAVANDQV